MKKRHGTVAYGVKTGKGRWYLHINALWACQYLIVSTSHRVCTMKNIDFTDFFNVFLSGATISGALFCLLFKRVSSFVGSPSHSPKQARYSRFFCAMRQSYIPKWKSLHRRLQGPYSKACKIQLQITCRATAQSKTQQKRQDRILFTPLVPDRTLIRVRFSRLCVHRLTPCPAAGFCIRRDSVTASIIGLLFWPTILPTTQFYYILLNYLFFQKSFDIPCIMSF